MRGSTDRQEIDSQKKDLTRIAIEREGFLASNIIYIGKAGASAIKQNDLYMAEVNELLSTLDKDSSVKTVFVWEISRLARVELAFYKMKDYFTTHHIQLICQTPNLRLYDADGKINQGTELTFSLLITLAKQEMEIKQARFKRGRDKAREEGKFGGGAYGAMYGYRVDENGYIVPDPEEVANINEIYNLYVTGKYSTYTLYEELKNRGFKTRGTAITVRKLQKILSTTAYIGHLGIRNYPVIVDRALWDKAAKIRANKDIIGVHTTKETRNIHFGIKHLICKECGNNMIALKNRYCCYRHHIKGTGIKCNCTDGINIDWFDKIIWEVAQLEHITYLDNSSDESIADYEAQKGVLAKKITESKKNIDKLDIRRERIAELYMAGDITKVKYEAQKGKLTADLASFNADIDRYQTEIENIDKIINSIKNPTDETIINMVADVMDIESRKKIKEIIDMHIGTCTLEKKIFRGYKAIQIDINTTRNTLHQFMFLYGAKRIFKFNGTEWIEDDPKFYRKKKAPIELDEDNLRSVLENETLPDNERALLLSILAGKDIRE